MNPHPRPPIIRKTIKWGGAVVTVLLVVVWVGCANSYIDYVDGSASWFGVGHGAVFVARWPGHYPKLGDTPLERDQLARQREFLVFGIDNHAWKPQWRTRFHERDLPFYQRTGYEHLIAPLWVLLVTTVVATAIAWMSEIRARRRARPNLCPKCNYDRTGLALGATCPECGAGPAGV